MNSSNLVVVAAAGNDGTDISNFSPAGVKSVITVGAYNENFEVAAFTNVPWSSPATAYFNNYGAALDMFSLGVNVSCADIASPSSYADISGTSISAGIVAGAAIQWANTYPTKTSSELKEVILQEGHLKGVNRLVFDSSSPIATSDVYRSVITVPMVNQAAISNLPSGRVLNVQLGNTATKDLELNLTGATDFAILSFAPIPPWASIDLSTGILSVDVTSGDTSLAPGVYLFGIKGTVEGKVTVEEYSIGIYNTLISELEEATQYYYDEDTNSYDQVIAYNVAASFKN
jgi:hypothetical protein